MVGGCVYDPTFQVQTSGSTIRISDNASSKASPSSDDHCPSTSSRSVNAESPVKPVARCRIWRTVRLRLQPSFLASRSILWRHAYILAVVKALGKKQAWGPGTPLSPGSTRWNFEPPARLQRKPHVRYSVSRRVHMFIGALAYVPESIAAPGFAAGIWAREEFRFWANIGLNPWWLLEKKT